MFIELWHRTYGMNENKIKIWLYPIEWPIKQPTNQPTDQNNQIRKPYKCIKNVHTPNIFKNISQIDKNLCMLYMWISGMRRQF